MVARTHLSGTLYGHCLSCYDQVLCSAKQPLLQIHPQTFISGARALSYVRISFDPDRSDSPLLRHIGKFPLYNSHIPEHDKLPSPLRQPQIGYRQSISLNVIHRLVLVKGLCGAATDVCVTDGFRDYTNSELNKQYSCQYRTHTKNCDAKIL
jgi:hypothetical protein